MYVEANHIFWKLLAFVSTDRESCD